MGLGPDGVLLGPGEHRDALGVPEGGEGTESSGPSRLPIAVNADSLATWFVPALAPLARDARIHVDQRREDGAHPTALLRAGEVMAAVTSSPDPVAGCSVSGLGAMVYLPVAAPQFAARWLDGEVAQLLSEAPVVCFRPSRRAPGRLRIMVSTVT
ncbi:hypothetical protein [Kitasatospora aureofaciens]|uniref:hypothetical protein n=1 Tax=Kitasatospora aureofaciens TaxID=1894 RepID=UPI00068ADBD2